MTPLIVSTFLALAAPPPAPPAVFAPDNLVAWCVVPFDAKKRTPAERAEMLSGLGFKRFAYDWRAAHLPTFDQEVRELAARKIELTAVWFPANLGPDATALLGVIAAHKLTPQLWVMLPEPAGATRDAKAAAAVGALRPVAEAAAKLGCKVAVYNHGGWAGEPENMVAVVEALKMPNVGIVYNLHHGHAHLDRFPAALKAMLPHLLGLNLNGMEAGGDKHGRKLLPIGVGDRDRELLGAILASGYAGPVGVLGHTQDDAADRLRDNLDGLAWVVKALDGADPGPPPAWRTHKGK